MTERQELYCHDCNNYVQFDIDLSLDGNHVLECPKCGHEHCRVVKNGEITDIRWDSRNGINICVSSATITVSTVSTYSTFVTSSTGDTFLAQSWLNTVSTS